MDEHDRGVGASSAEGWRADPFGRHESRFYDGVRWTPHVRDGETHSLDEPVQGIKRDSPGPEILTASVLVVEQLPESHDLATPYSVHAPDGRGLGVVRPSVEVPGRYEVHDADGLPALTLSKAPSGRKTVVTVRDAGGAEMGRLLEQHLPGARAFALESSAGGNVGFLRARTWVGWDIRVEDERSRTVATITKRWDGLDRAAVPVADGYVARIDREMSDPQRALVYAAALCVDSLLVKDSRAYQ